MKDTLWLEKALQDKIEELFYETAREKGTEDLLIFCYESKGCVTLDLPPLAQGDA